MSKTVKEQKTIHYKKKTFIGMLKNSDSALTVKVAQTAQGQMITAGYYDTIAKKWHDANRRTVVPTFVREELEKAFRL